MDAHAIIHRAYHALPDFLSSKGEPTGALYGLTTMLIKIINELRPDYIIAAYDLPKPTYRHEVYKEYKAGRAKAEPALVAQLQSSRDLLAALAIPIYDKEGFEADDILGTIVSSLQPATNNLQLEIVIASGDMDTLQLVDDKKVQVYTLRKGIQDTILYDEGAVVKRFGFGPELLPDYKALRGDPSDNIIGVKGIGEKTATELVQKFGAIENLYKILEKNKKKLLEAGVKERVIELLEKNKEEAEFSKILATIRRDAPIDFKLPPARWAESVDLKTADELFSNLEFRTVSQRLRQAVSGKIAPAAVSAEAPAPAPNGATGALFYTPAAELTQEAGIMLWLINSNFTNPTWEDIRLYTKKEKVEDALAYLSGEIKKQGLLRVYEEIEKPLMPVIDRMNKRGVKIDTAYLAALGKEYGAALKKLEEQIWKSAGEKFNIASPKQLGQILFVRLGLKAKNQKKTGGGALSTKESELQKLADVHPIIPMILEYRELAKLLGTYIENVIPMVGSDGRLHARFISSGAATGRMSSESPNLQNLPTHSELGRRIRNAVVAEEGSVLVSFDYSQIELRIAAFLSGDKELIRIFKEGRDVHAAVAAAVFNVPIDKVDKEMRRRAKVINFGVMYGMGVVSLQKALAAPGGAPVPRAEAQKFYDDYFKTFSGLAEYLGKVKKETARRGYTETAFGRRRYFEGINSRLPFIKAAAERMAINAPIQGTEADIIKLAMNHADLWLKENKLSEKVRLILQVHDELVYEMEKSLVKKVAPEIKKIMESQVDPKISRGVPIVAEVSVGENWGNMLRVAENIS